jgi:hypothetical protein
MPERLVRSRWQLLFPVLLAVAVPAAWIGYALALHASGIELIVFLVVVGYFAARAVLAAVVSLLGPSPELTADGIRLRRRLLPWSSVQMLWIEYFGRRRYLSALTTEPGRRRPHRIRLPAGSAGPDELNTAMRTLSHGTVELADRGPERESSAFDGDDGPGRRRSFRVGRATKLPVWAYILSPALVAIALPFVLDRPQPWRQPWWPGVEAAIVAPNPCDAISADVARDLFASATGQLTDDRGDHRSCRIAGGQAEMIVEYSVFNPAFGSSRDEATDHMNQARSRAGSFLPEPVPGLGDQAWIAGNPQGTTTLMDRGQALLVVRRANVVLEILYRGESEPGIARAAVLSTAQRAIGAAEIG